jgi:drug/metabolite transporter (DMT)-like permease
MISLFICAAFSTSLAYFLQNKYQKHTTAAKTALIFAMEPAFATFFGYIINDEVPSPGIWMGGLLIFLSLIVSSLYPYIKGIFVKSH